MYVNLSKYSILLKAYGCFHILASALPRSVKIGIWQAYWLDLIGINLRKTIKYLRFQELWIFSLSNFGLGIVWVKEKSQFLCLDIINTNAYTFLFFFFFFLSKYIVWLNTYGDFQITIFCFGVVSVKEKLHLVCVLARSCWLL